MVRRVFLGLRQQWMGAVALLVVLTGGTAYAVGTIGSADIIDNSLKSVDIRNDSSTGGGLTSADIRNDALTGSDIAESTLGAVPDTDLLDGLDSTAFAQGRIISGSATAAPGGSATLMTDNGVFHLEFACPSPTQASAGYLNFWNDDVNDPTADLFIDMGNADPWYRPVGGGNFNQQRMSIYGDSFTYQMHAGNTMATVWVSTVNRDNDCYVQAQAVIN